MSIFSWMGYAPLYFFIFMIILVAGVSIQTTENYDPEIIPESLDNSYRNISQTFQVRENNTQIINIFYKIIDTTLYAGFEGAKIGASWSYENREWINYKLLVWLFLLAMLSFFIVPITKFSVICFILIKEYRQTKREKRELLALTLKEIRL